jgi:ribosomal protein L31
MSNPFLSRNARIIPNRGADANRFLFRKTIATQKEFECEKDLDTSSDCHPYAIVGNKS